MTHEPAVGSEVSRPLLSVQNLSKYFPVRRGVVFSRRVGWIKAIDGVSFSVQPGESFGLVGESGCGKTTVGKTLVRLYSMSGGTIALDGVDITHPDAKALAAIRQRIQIVFQDPYSSLNPSMTVGEAVCEPLMFHGLLTREEAYGRVVELLNEVGLDESHFYRYPHEFSGGQRQRIGIARALAMDPDLIIADEPVSALDVSIQAQILKLLKTIQERRGISFIFIAHNLAVVKMFCDQIAVMYLGRIVEMADSATLFADPRHPYTQALLEAVPVSNPDRRRPKEILRGETPSPLNPPAGCHFHPRCPRARAECREIDPALEPLAPGHWVACPFAREAMTPPSATPGNLANGDRAGTRDRSPEK